MILADMENTLGTAIVGAVVAIVLAALQIWRDYLQRRRDDRIKLELMAEAARSAADVKDKLEQTNAKTDQKLTKLVEESVITTKLVDSAILGQKEMIADTLTAKAESTKATVDKLSAKAAQEKVEEHRQEQQKREEMREDPKISHGDLTW